MLYITPNMYEVSHTCLYNLISGNEAKVKRSFIVGNIKYLGTYLTCLEIFKVEKITNEVNIIKG